MRKIEEEEEDSHNEHFLVTPSVTYFVAERDTGVACV